MKLYVAGVGTSAGRRGCRRRALYRQRMAAESNTSVYTGDHSGGSKHFPRGAGSEERDSSMPANVWALAEQHCASSSARGRRCAYSVLHKVWDSRGSVWRFEHAEWGLKQTNVSLSLAPYFCIYYVLMCCTVARSVTKGEMNMFYCSGQWWLNDWRGTPSVQPMLGVWFRWSLGEWGAYIC